MPERFTSCPQSDIGEKERNVVPVGVCDRREMWVPGCQRKEGKCWLKSKGQGDCKVSSVCETKQVFRSSW